MNRDNATSSSPTPLTEDEVNRTRALQAQKKPPASVALAWLVAGAALLAILSYVYL